MRPHDTKVNQSLRDTPRVDTLTRVVNPSQSPNAVRRFETIRRIASGGTSDITLAIDRHILGAPRRVAIKSLASNLAQQPEMVRMFQHEAWLLAQLSHPSIPAIYGVWNERETWHTAMSFVQGTTLDTLPALPLEHVLTIALQLTHVLHTLHTAHDLHEQPLCIVHRDISPANVIVRPDGTLCLIDFGIATSSARAELRDGSLRGTSGYMAPEVIDANPVIDARADIFSLGVVLHELITHKRLFEGNLLSVLNAVMHAPIPPPSRIEARCPAWLDALILHCLERDPDKRMQSVLELEDALASRAQQHGLVTSTHALTQWMKQATKHA